jgi:isoquinoline 1-oxidoreductase beta subunit
MKNGLDPTAMAGVADVAYDIPNYLATYVDYEHAVPVGFLRAPAANWNTFVVESFVDELAHAAGADPVAFRMAMLGKSPRSAAVLERATREAGWGKAHPGVKQGVALCFWDGSYGALVADVSMDGKTPVVHRVTFALDCGTVINPDIVNAQAQGAINYGLSMALMSKVTVAKGRIEQNNFYDFTVLKLQQAPKTMAIHIVPSTEAPTGIGELGTPPIAPAVANAVFALTGKRARTLPLTDALA